MAGFEDIQVGASRRKGPETAPTQAVASTQRIRVAVFLQLQRTATQSSGPANGPGPTIRGSSVGHPFVTVTLPLPVWVTARGLVGCSQGSLYSAFSGFSGRDRRLNSAYATPSAWLCCLHASPSWQTGSPKTGLGNEIPSDRRALVTSSQTDFPARKGLAKSTRYGMRSVLGSPPNCYKQPCRMPSRLQRILPTQIEARMHSIQCGGRYTRPESF